MGYLNPEAGKARESLATLGPFSNAGAPTSGTSGTLAGKAEKGAQLTDTANGKVYVNTGTKASPTWTVVGSQT